jgi:3-methyladenine DNA glycosylase AlkD
VTRRPPSPPWVERERRRILGRLRLLGAPAGNDVLRSYLGSPAPVLGVRASDLRSLVREAAGRLRERSPADRRGLVRRLWRGTWFEERVVAIELLGTRSLLDDRVAWGLGTLWVGAATGWALSDSLAAGPIAAGVAARPQRFEELLRWTRSPNPWRRRASTYALKGWFRSGELDRPFELLERLLDDPERWVQRAVGTWLRECWKRDRRRTERFLRRELPRLAPIAITVATERAPKRFREELRRKRAHRSFAPRGL